MSLITNYIVIKKLAEEEFNKYYEETLNYIKNNHILHNLLVWDCTSIEWIPLEIYLENEILSSKKDLIKKYEEKIKENLFDTLSF